jgi:hypothetical protein
MIPPPPITPLAAVIKSSHPPYTKDNNIYARGKMFFLSLDMVNRKKE